MKKRSFYCTALKTWTYIYLFLFLEKQAGKSTLPDLSFGSGSKWPRAIDIVHSEGERKDMQKKRRRGGFRESVCVSFLFNKSKLCRCANQPPLVKVKLDSLRREKRNKKRSTHSVGTDQQGGVGSLLLVFCRIVDNTLFGQSWCLKEKKTKQNKQKIYI